MQLHSTKLSVVGGAVESQTSNWDVPPIEPLLRA